jgi:hypothetical protein
MLCAAMVVTVCYSFIIVVGAFIPVKTTYVCINSVPTNCNNFDNGLYIIVLTLKLILSEINITEICTSGPGILKQS